jgi:hypothetical protein
VHLTSTCLAGTDLAHFVQPRSSHNLSSYGSSFISILTSISTFVVRYLSTPLLTSTAYGIQCLSHSAWLGGYTHSSRHFHASVSWLEVPQIAHKPGDVIRGVQRRSTAAFESSGSWMFNGCCSYPIRIHHTRYHREYHTFLGFVEIPLSQCRPI